MSRKLFDENLHGPVDGALSHADFESKIQLPDFDEGPIAVTPRFTDALSFEGEEIKPLRTKAGTQKLMRADWARIVEQGASLGAFMAGGGGGGQTPSRNPNKVPTPVPSSSYSLPAFWLRSQATVTGNTISFQHAIPIYNRQSATCCCEIHTIEIGSTYCYQGYDANRRLTTWDQDGQLNSQGPSVLQDLCDLSRLQEIAKAVRYLFPNTSFPGPSPLPPLSTPCRVPDPIPSEEDKFPVEPTARPPIRFLFKPKQDMTPQEMCQLIIEAGLFGTLFSEGDLNKLGAINTNLLRHFDKE